MCLKYKPKQQITNAGVSDYKLYTSHCLEISNPIPSTHPLIWSTMLLHLSEDGLLQGVTNIKFWYERIFEYIYIQKTIQTNIWIYSHQKNDTNMIRTNIRIGKYSNVRIHTYQIFDISFRFDARCWIFDVWYNIK